MSLATMFKEFLAVIGSDDNECVFSWFGGGFNLFLISNLQRAKTSVQITRAVDISRAVPKFQTTTELDAAKNDVQRWKSEAEQLRTQVANLRGTEP